MAPVDVTIYNAFSSSSVSGNPAAVIVLPRPGECSGHTVSHNEQETFQYTLFPPDSALQAIAKKINLPMTAFLIPLKTSKDNSETAHYALRWFNPSNEVPLCGHATLASSHHLFSTLPEPLQALRYWTRLHGPVSASLHQDPFEKGKLVGIEFPELINLPIVSKASERWKELKNILEKATSSVWEGRGEPLGLYEGDSYVLLEYSPDLDLKGLHVDLLKLSGVSPEVLYIFQVSTQQPEHVHTRVFNTGAHAQEDIATGSAHRAIIPHVISNAESRARLEQYHPGFSGNTLRVVQQSPEGGELIVTWLQEAKLVRIMGKVSFLDKSSVEIPT